MMNVKAHFYVLIVVLAAPGAQVGLAQRVVTQDAGAGKKMQLIYDDAGQVVETRTLDPAGHLMVVVQSEYRPGYLVPQHKTTTYTANGETVDSVARVSFDPNGNFLSEIKSRFDPAGKQIAGTRVLHDPWTGIYQCAEWDAAKRNYKMAKCPAGEGSGEAESPADLSREQIMKELEEARAARADLRSSGAAANPEAGSAVTPSPDHGGQRPTPQRQPKAKAEVQPNVQTSPLCLKGGECVITGTFSGDSSTTLIAFGSHPAPIVAETRNAVRFTVPKDVRPGANHLIVTDSAWQGVEVLPVAVSEISFSFHNQELKAGQPELVHTMLAGPEELSDEQWRAGTFAPGATLEAARQLVPGFELPRDFGRSADRRSADSREKNGEPGRAGHSAAGEQEGNGIVLLVLWNDKREGLSLRGATNQKYSFNLTPQSFERGEFRFQFVIDATQPGKFELRGTIVPFLAPVRGKWYS